MSALHRRRLLTGIGSALAVGLAGCGSDGDGTATDPGTDRDPAPTTGTAAGAARLRIAHMSPDAPDIVAAVDDEVIPEAVGLPFGRVSEYVPVPAGSRRVTLTEADSEEVLLDRTASLEAAAYTFVAAGEVIDGEPDFRVLPLRDDTSDPGADMARLRVLHVSPDAGPVDVTLEAGPVLFEGLAFTEGGYVPVEAGEYTVQVRAGTGDGDDDGGGGGADEVIAERTVSLRSGGVYTAFAAGYRDIEFAADTAFDLTVVRDAAP